jgi:ketosteroid isomerase-like protein
MTSLRQSLPLVLLLAVLSGPGCSTSSTSSTTPARPDTAASRIQSVLDQQVADWNAGNLRDFMNGYARSETTRFASGGDVHLGWETVLARYTGRYADRAAMGRLAFEDIRITPLAPDAALVFGRWKLQRANDAPSGLFTLLFRRTPDGWRIVHDHTSSATP